MSNQLTMANDVINRAYVMKPPGFRRDPKEGVWRASGWFTWGGTGTVVCPEGVRISRPFPNASPCASSSIRMVICIFYCIL